MNTRPPGRLLSLDAFRGATIAAMLFVNNHALWAVPPPPIPAQLRHRLWHGCTLTDLVFPFFLFIVGVAMPFSDAKRRAAGESFRAAWGHALRRAVAIFALGMFLQSVARGTPVLDLEVLQRIAVCYLAAFAVLRAPARAQAAAVAGLFAAYLLLMLAVRAPGIPWDLRWDKGCTLAEFLDTRWLPSRQPNNEGLVSTLPAITSVIFGIMAGRWLSADRAPARKAALLAGIGAAAAGVGLLFHTALAGTPLWIPLNKILWTPSYAVFTAGWACLALGLLYYVMDARGLRAWARPFVIYGSNALGVYAFSRLFGMWILRTWTLDAGDGRTMTLSLWLYRHAEAVLGPTGGSFAHSAFIVGVGFLFCWLLWRRRWFLRV